MLTRTLISVAVVTALIVVPLNGGALDAENRHGDPGNAGRANFIGTNPMTMHWSVPIKPTARDRLSASNGKQAIVISDHQSVMCIDTETGENVWDKRLTTPTYIADSPTITDTLGIVTCHGGYVITYDLTRGCELFRLGTGWRRMSSPKCSENFILTTGANEELTNAGIMAISPVTGRISWKMSCRPLLQSPALGPGYVIVPSKKSGDFRVVSESDGSLLWENSVSEEIAHISTRFGLIAIETETTLTIFNFENGEVLWSWSSDDGATITWPATIAYNNIFICTDDGKRLYAINPENGQTNWRSELESSTKQPIVGRDYLILTLERAISIRNQSDGEELWSINTVGSTIGNTLAVSDNMMIATSLSKFISLKTAGYEIASDTKHLDLGTITDETPYVFNSDITLTNRSISETHPTITSDADWLSVGPERSGFVGGGQMDVSVAVNLEGMPDDTYESKINVAWEYGELTIPVTATKVTAIPEPLRPGFVSIDRSSITFTCALNTHSNPESIIITNTGEMTTGYQLETDIPWLFFSRNEGTLRPGENAMVGIACIPHNASMGANQGMVTVTSDTDQSVTVFVDLKRIPGRDLIIMKIIDGKNWIDVNGIRFRCRPSPRKANGAILLPLRILAIVLNADLKRWQGNPDTPCKTEFNQLTRNGITIGNCVGSDILSIEGDDGKTITEQISACSQIIDDHVMLPVRSLLEAFDNEMEIRVEENVTFFELSFPELVSEL